MQLILNKLKASFISQYTMLNPIDIAEFVLKNITEKGYTKVIRLEYDDEDFLFLIHPEDYNYFSMLQDVYLVIAASNSTLDLPINILETFGIETDGHHIPSDLYFDEYL